MQEKPRIVHHSRVLDHEPVITAARDDAGREAARYVYMTVGALWRLIHSGPKLEEARRAELGAAMRPR